MMVEMNTVTYFEESLSLVCPVNCGSFNLDERIELQFTQMSSEVNLTPRGTRLRNSQNSFKASVKPERNPFTWVPP